MSEPLTISKVNEVLQRIAYKIAKDAHGLTRDDFRITFFPWRRHAWRIRRLGAGIGVYFGIFPLDKEFKFYLDQALIAVKRALEGKPALELLSRMKQRAEVVKDSNWESLPKLVPRDELEVEEIYRVVVKHRRTGVVVVKEMSRPTFSKMILDARIELAETLDAIEKAEGGKLP